ncbi:uncharacterized protein LOC144405481 [Gasterosteus aculeatus]
MCPLREVQGSLANQAPEDQWVQGDMKGHLERRAEGEQKDHMAQRGPKETPAGMVFLVFLVMMAYKATLEQAVSPVCRGWMAVMGPGVGQEFGVFLVWMVSMDRRDHKDLKELKESPCTGLPFQGFRGIVDKLDNLVHL